MVAKIITKHCEARDEIYWKYALRDEVPTPNEVFGIKKLDLSFNKLGVQTAFHIGQAIKNDSYLKQLNLRSNLIEASSMLEILDHLK